MKDDWRTVYGDQTETDHATLAGAIKKGRVKTLEAM